MNDYWSDYGEMLTYFKPFREPVVTFRTEWGIPSGGFTDKESRGNWYRDFFACAEYDPDERYRYQLGYRYLPPNEKFITSLKELALYFGLDERWYLQLVFHAAGSDLELKDPQPSAAINLNINDAHLPDEERMVTSISIVIQKDTSLEDIRSLWSKVQDLQSRMEGSVPERRRKVSKENKERYITIRQLEDEGLKHEQIAERLGIIDTTEISRIKDRVEKHFKQ
jgi:hypothetical protein